LLSLNQKAALFDKLGLDARQYPQCGPFVPQMNKPGDEDVIEICERCDKCVMNGFWCATCKLYSCELCGSRDDKTKCFYCSTGELRPT
jgi:hypothetical protein